MHYLDLLITVSCDVCRVCFVDNGCVCFICTLPGASALQDNVSRQVKHSQKDAQERRLGTLATADGNVFSTFSRCMHRNVRFESVWKLQVHCAAIELCYKDKCE